MYLGQGREVEVIQERLKEDPKFYWFTKIIYNLHSWTDLYNLNITLEMNLKQPELIWYGIIEEDFLPQLEKYCNKS